MAEAADNPSTDTQLVKLALVIIQTTGNFEETIIHWNSGTASIRKCSNFKPLFGTRRNSLYKARGKTMQGAGLKQANLLAEHMQNTMNHMESTILSCLDALEQQEPEANSDNIPPDAANFTTDATTDILEALKKLTANYNKIENRVAQMNNAGTSGISCDRTNDDPQGQRYSYQQRPRTITTSTVTLMVVAVIQVPPAKPPRMDTRRTLRFKTRWAEVLIFVMTQHDRLRLVRTVEKDG